MIATRVVMNNSALFFITLCSSLPWPTGESSDARKSLFIPAHYPPSWIVADAALRPTTKAYLQGAHSLRILPPNCNWETSVSPYITASVAAGSEFTLPYRTLKSKKILELFTRFFADFCQIYPVRKKTLTR
jgi:hypothetical protein